jgi:hypothetical protein
VPIYDVTYRRCSDEIFQISAEDEDDAWDKAQRHMQKLEGHNVKHCELESVEPIDPADENKDYLYGDKG